MYICAASFSPHVHTLYMYMYLGEHSQVELPARWEVLLTQQHRGVRAGEGVFTVQVSSQTVPVLQTDLEDLLLIHLRDQHQVVQCLADV